MKNLTPLFGSSLEGKLMGTLLLVVLSLVSRAQVPNCIEINASIDLEGFTTIEVDELISNIADVAPVSITIRIPNSFVLAELPEAMPGDVMTFEGCSYRTSDVRVYVSNSAGGCEAPLSFVESPPIGYGYHDTVYCHEALDWSKNMLPLKLDDSLQFKSSCRGEITYGDIKKNPDQYYSNIWQQDMPCDTTEEVSICCRYIKEFEYFDKSGNRIVKHDTLSILHYPKITPDRLIVDQEDTIYCGQTYVQTLVSFVHEVEENGQMVCDTVPMIVHDSTGARILDCFKGECRLSLSYSERDVFETTCISSKGLTIQFIQTCWQPGSSDAGACAVSDPPEVASGEPEFGKFAIELWLTELDTTSPIIYGPDEILKATTSAHDCEGTLYLPEIAISDCSGVRKVYVHEPGFKRHEMSRTASGKWKLSSGITINASVADTAFVIIEAIDSCGNSPGLDTIYYATWDQVNPVAIANHEIIAGLTKKVNWIKASSINEGSRDNCGIVHVWARRKNWYEACGVNLCDKKIEGEVEEKYDEWRHWLEEDNLRCSDLMIEEWDKDIAYRCPGTDDHGNPIGGDRPQLGGGWMDVVPFCCEDACTDIDIELLVMDVHCNWSTSWTTVHIEDKQPVQVLSKLTSGIEISCTTYEEEYKDLVETAMAYNGADIDNPDRVLAFAKLDDALGGYHKAWLDPQTGTPIDADGNTLTAKSRTVNSKYCFCETKTRKVSQIDEHTGEVIWVYEEYEECSYKSSKTKISNGIVAVNCNGKVVEDIWVNLDDCGRGFIDRRFKISGGCLDAQGNHKDDSEVIIQRIYIGNTCDLSIGMFDTPQREQYLEICDLETDASGNLTGDLHPDQTGWVTYSFDDPCTHVGIGYYDQVYTLSDGPAQRSKIIRTWCMTDWCNAVDDHWMLSDDPKVIKWEQVFVVTTGVNCSSSSEYVISGSVVNHKGLSANEVELTLSSGNQNKKYTTNTSGTYSFTVNSDSTYNLYAEKTSKIYKGVDILDILAVQRHVLGSTFLMEADQKIAADVNEDDFITTQDVIEIKRAILRQIEVFSGGNTWTIRNQADLSKNVTITNPMSNEVINFFAIKLGDVNYSASPNRSKKDMDWVITDQSFGSGQQVVARIRPDEEKNLDGFQFGLTFDKDILSPKSVTVNGRAIESTDYQIVEDELLLLHTENTTWTETDEIEIIFETYQTSTLAETISQSDRVRSLGAASGEETNFNLSFDNRTKLELKVYQNQPNPFSTDTQIPFDLSEDKEVSLEVFDITGRSLLLLTQNFSAGTNHFRISTDRLSGPGIYIYRVFTEEKSMSYKMLAVD